MEYPKIETLYERDLITFKVNPERLKNPVYGIVNPWEWTEKIDGTNIRLDWRERRLRIGGRTDATQISAKLLTALVDVAAQFAAHYLDTRMIVYGEGYGAGIQKGGGEYSPTQQVAVFDVLIDGKWWMSRENVEEIATNLGLNTVPYVEIMTLADATAYVQKGFPSALNNGARQAEGLVGRTLEPLFDKQGHRLIVKLKARDF